jgi:ParB-like chromosome segregation protein Spo0J
MSTTIGFKPVPIDNITLSGQFPLHLKDPASDRKALTIRRVGIIHEPVLRALPDGRLICIAGERRIAGCKKANVIPVCKIVECSDEEAAAITLIENADREHNPTRQRAELLELTETLANDFAQEPLTGKKTPKGQARKAAAALRGVNPESIRQAERRERIKQEATAKAEEPYKPPIGLLGMKPAPEVVENAGRAVDAVETMIALVQKARAELGELLLAPGVHQARAKALQAQMEEVSARLRGMRPTYLCPACKALPKIMVDCVTCETTGYVSKDMEGQIPARLWDENDKVVRVGKGYVPASQYMPEEVEEDWSF